MLRVWLDDRPGALGAVASRIGSVKGDLVGIEILERGGGRVIDELMVDIPSIELVELMTREIMEVDGVDVEDIRPASRNEVADKVGILRIAGLLVDARDAKDILNTLATHLVDDLESEWVSAMHVGSGEARMSRGPCPSGEWLMAFLEGTSYSGATNSGPNDLAWAVLGDTELRAVIGRTNRPYRMAEREQLTELAHIAGVRIKELT